MIMNSGNEVKDAEKKRSVIPNSIFGIVDRDLVDKESKSPGDDAIPEALLDEDESKE